MATKPNLTAVRPTILRKLQTLEKDRTIDQRERRIEEVLSFPILLSDKIIDSVKESKSFTFECSEVGKQVERLRQMLRSAVRLATSSSSGSTFYELPLRRVAAEVSKNIEKTRALVNKCRRRSFIRRVVNRVSATDFRRLLDRLDSSVADMKWVLSVFDGGIVLTLPPIASNDPIISFVWSFIAALYVGQLRDKIEAANELASLAKDSDRNKQIIVEGGGVLPLLKLLKDSLSLEGQMAAATALYNVVTDAGSVQSIVDVLGVPIIVKVLGDSEVKVQVMVAKLVGRMAKHSPLAQEYFSREYVIRPLVMLLSCDLFVGDTKLKLGKRSIHSIIRINKEMEEKNLYKPSSGSSVLPVNYMDVSCEGGDYREERENEDPEVKLMLKTSCAEALWMLAKGSMLNCGRISETKGLLCLAKLVETENGELQSNCLMTIMEITAAAESDADLRRATFKTSSPAAKMVVDQLLRMIKDSDQPMLQLGAIRAVGNLARTFPARETRVISPIVKQLSHRNQDVATEAAISLEKFVCPENFLCVEHSKTIIEFRAVEPLMRLLRVNERAKLHGLVLICYLAIHAGKCEDLKRSGVRNAFEGVDRSFIAHHPELKHLLPQAIYHLNVCRPSNSGVLSQRQL